MEHDYDSDDPEGQKEKDEIQNWRDQYKVPLACYACNKLMYNFDNKPFYRYGCCQECFINWIDERDLDENLLKDRARLLAYLKEKIEEKKN